MQNASQKYNTKIFLTINTYLSLDLKRKNFERLVTILQVKSLDTHGR